MKSRGQYGKCSVCEITSNNLADHLDNEHLLVGQTGHVLEDMMIRMEEMDARIRILENKETL